MGASGLGCLVRLHSYLLPKMLLNAHASCLMRMEGLRWHGGGGSVRPTCCEHLVNDGSFIEDTCCNRGSHKKKMGQRLTPHCKSIKMVIYIKYIYIYMAYFIYTFNFFFLKRRQIRSWSIYSR